MEKAHAWRGAPSARAMRAPQEPWPARGACAPPPLPARELAPLWSPGLGLSARLTSSARASWWARFALPGCSCCEGGGRALVGGGVCVRTIGRNTTCKLPGRYLLFVTSEWPTPELPCAPLGLRTLGMRRRAGTGTPPAGHSKDGAGSEVGHTGLTCATRGLKDMGLRDQAGDTGWGRSPSSSSSSSVTYMGTTFENCLRDGEGDGEGEGEGEGEARGAGSRSGASCCW
jgi:hypothetical protein